MPSPTPRCPDTDARPARAGWVEQVADTQIRQLLLPAETVATLRWLLGHLDDRAAIARQLRSYQTNLKDAAAQLNATERVAMVSRLGPVMPGQWDHPGGRTLTLVLTTALLHAAVDDLATAMPVALLCHHRQVALLLAEVEDLAAALNGDAQCERVAAALVAGWSGTLTEFTSTVQALASAPATP